jgi:hypothetical protein
MSWQREAPYVATERQAMSAIGISRRFAVTQKFSRTLVSMVDYNQELPYWNEKVMPLLGKRDPSRFNGITKVLSAAR